MTDMLNQIAEKWFAWQLSMFWQVGLLIVIVAGLDLLIKKWAWPQIRYALWLLILVKLVLPPSLTSPMSFTAEIPFMAKEAATKIGQLQTPPQKIKTVNLIQPVATKETIQPTEAVSFTPIVLTAETAHAVSPVSPKAYALSIWLAGVVILSSWLIIRLSNLRREHIKSRVSNLPERLKNLLASTTQTLGLKKAPQVILTNKVNCPAVLGVFRPVLLMPADKLRNMTSQDAEHIFLHELAHIKRGDLFVHAVYMILQIAYWFNPLLWLTRKHLQNLRELCCDATVARILREKTIGYRQTLLEAARQLLAQPVDPGLGLLGLFENSSWLVDRLRWLEKKSWRYRPLRIATIFVLISLMTACVLPMANPGPPKLVIKGIVTDLQTGEPIAGAKVFDDGYGPAPDWNKIKPDQRAEWGAITNSKGEYSFLTWPEHHSIKAEISGFKAGRKTLYSGHFTLNKKDEEVFDFALKPEKSPLEATVSIKQIMKLAQKKAKSLNHEYIGTEHILLVIAEEKGVASDILNNAGIDKDKLSAEIMKAIKKGTKPVVKKSLLITPRAQQAIDYAVRQAGDENNLDTRDILLGLMQVEDGIAAQVLKNLGLEKEKVINFAPEPKKGTGEKEGARAQEQRSKENEKRQDSFSATLSNGTTVELVNVCDYPGEKPRCWRPNGTESKEKLFVKRERNYSDGKFGFIIKANGPNDFSFAWNEIEGSNGYHGSCAVIDEKDKPLEGFEAAIVKEYKGGDTTNLRVGTATGYWKTIASHNGKGMTTTSGRDILFSSAYEGNNFVGITVSSPWDRNRVERIVAVDKDGQTHITKNIGSVASGEIDQMTAKFNGIKLEDIAEFHFQTRSYEWVEFKNVSLKPGFKTDVQIGTDVQTGSSTGEDSQKSAEQAEEQKDASRYKELLSKSVTVDIDKSPDGSGLTVQYAVIGICETAGVPYQWSKSAKLTESKCRNYIEPIHIKNEVASDAVKNILKPLGLSYGLDTNGLYLYHSDSQTPVEQIAEEKAAPNIDSLLADVNGMLMEMQPYLAEIQAEAVKLQELKTQNASEDQIKASENRIKELGKKIDAIGSKWGKKMDSTGEQLGKDIQTRAENNREYWEQFGEKMAELGERMGKWGEQFGQQMQEKYGHKNNTYDAGKNNYEKTETLSQLFPEGSLLVVDIPDGKVTITGGSRKDCYVIAKIKAEDRSEIEQIKLNLKEENGKIIITLDNSDNRKVRGITRGISVDMNINLPYKASVQCQIGDGSFICSQLEGKITASVGDGTVDIIKLTGDAKINLGDGKVYVEDAKFADRCDVQIGDGMAILENIRGKAHYEIDIGDGTAKVAYAKDADGVGHMEVDVADGKIEFGSPANMSAKIAAEVKDGKIQTSLPLTIERKEDGDGAELGGTLGTGEGYVELKVNDGSIVIY